MPVNPFQQQNELYYATNHYLNSGMKNLEVARQIANGYKNLWHLFKNIPTAPQTIELQKVSSPYRREFSKLKPYAKNFLIHGSRATGDPVSGFSDLDTFVILKRETCLDFRKLSELRQKVSSLKKLLLKIDPLAHHGLIFCNEQNLDYYPQHYLPVTVFRYAKSLYGPAKIKFNLRDSEKEAKENFYHYYKIFQEIAKTGAIKNKPGSKLYQLKWFVSMLLLMPSLYLQAKGIYLYKKFSFDFVKHPFLTKLSRARKDFRRVKEILGKNYFQKALQMLTEWRKDLEKFEKERKVTNHPRRLPLSIYQEARQELISHFRKNSDVLALYEYGTVSAPGISDLDLILVLKEKLTNPFRYPSGPNIDKVARGTLIVMPESIFKNVQIFDKTRLKKLYGRDIKVKQLSKGEEKLRALVSIVDWLPERIIRLIGMLRSNPFDVQYALRYIRSFTYSLENAAHLTGLKDYAKLLLELKELRKNWKPGRTGQLRNLIKRAVYWGYEALNRFTKKYFFKSPASAGELELFKGQKIVFVDRPEKIDADWAIAVSEQNTANTVVVNPRLAPHFFTYSQQPGILAGQMRRQLRLKNGSLIKNKNYQQYLAKKMRLANRCAEFLRKNGFKSGLYRFGFYFHN